MLYFNIKDLLASVPSKKIYENQTTADKLIIGTTNNSYMFTLKLLLSFCSISGSRLYSVSSLIFKVSQL